MPRTTDLLYGCGTLPLSITDEWDATVIRKRSMPVVADSMEAMECALDEPVGARPVTIEARDADSACILICDVTRPVPNGVILPALLRALIGTGIDRSRITVLIATGLHRPVEEEELEELVGDPWVLETVRVENHIARDDETHVDLGTTARGTKIRLDRRFVDSILGKGHAAIDEWQTEMQVRTDRLGSIQLFTEGLSPQELALTGVEVIDDLEGAVARSVGQSGDRTLAVIPEGPYVVPFHRPETEGATT